METVVIIPIIIALILIGCIFYFGTTSKGRSKVMKSMMKSQMDMMKDMTSGDMGERLKELCSTDINVKKAFLKKTKIL